MNRNAQTNVAVQRRQPPRRSAFTLVELITAIAIGGVILASTATLVSRVMAANSAAAEHLHAMQAIGELGRQFRQDVHCATSVTIDEGPSPRLGLGLIDGSQIEYLATPTGVARQQTDNQQSTRREAYPLGAFKLLEIRRQPADSGAVQLLFGRVIRHVDTQVVQGPFAITALAAPTAATTTNTNPTSP